ncbi:protein kinase super [Blomia tropicalis]|nr:protein kinase super [Blomia tropicalis]
MSDSSNTPTITSTLKRLNFQPIDELKRSPSCAIYRGERRNDGEQSGGQDNDQLAQRKLRHATLVRMVQSTRTLEPNRIVLWMEYMEGGSLLDLILSESEPLDETIARQYYRQICDALKYMHAENFSHKNIKCEKILFNADRTICKLADYALTRSCFPYSRQQPLLDGYYCQCPSAAYIAPEVLIQDSRPFDQRPYNPFRSDVYSAGVVLYVITHRQLPIREWNLRFWIIAQMKRKFTINSRLTIELKELIESQLYPQPSVRPSMEEVVEFRWFTNVDPNHWSHQNVRNN